MGVALLAVGLAASPAAAGATPARGAGGAERAGGKGTAAEEKPDPVREKWGIEVVGVMLSAGGYMLDFRYRVVDPEKAKPLHRRGLHPYLVDQASGRRFVVPAPEKIGPLRNSDPPQKGRVYFMFFANPGKFVRRGAKVTVVMGDCRIENLVVR
ncbi:MAG: hypothetical protein D6708_09820 [Candidatus Dadabacteria bacterium]|nr:MAG: hypothetical protein D6708_09820 [Candidatus Dadabacteria bacterium]